MSNKFTCVMAFTIGVITGGSAAWLFAKKKYERIADEEINSVKEVYSRREAVVVNNTHSTEEQSTDQQCRESVIAYASRLHKEGYLSTESDRKERKGMSFHGPYVISPDEFGELDDYEKISLTYYSDGTLADDSDEEVEDIDSVVGSDSLKHFGEYEEDSVFVRNDKLKCDYEILMDQRPYSEVLKAKPYLRREE